MLTQSTSQYYFVLQSLHKVRQKSQFTSVFDDRTSFRACRGHFKLAIVFQFLTIELHFVRKGCDGRYKLAILLQFLTIEPHFVRKGCRGRYKLAILPQFLTIELHFVRKGCDGWYKLAILPLDDRTSFRAKGLPPTV